MTTITLIRDLADTGITLTLNGDKLRVEAPVGVITPDIRATLAEHKAELIQHMQVGATRARLLALADKLFIDSAIVHALPEIELKATCDQLADLDSDTTDAILRACLSAWSDTATREAGHVPAGDTATMLCRSCGPVWVHPSIAAVLPEVDGWPRAQGCPWCFIRKRVIAIPRPHVRCCECRHRMPDKINPEQGMGRCAVGNESATWPGRKHRCADFQLVEVIP